MTKAISLPAVEGLEVTPIPINEAACHVNVIHWNCDQPKTFYSRLAVDQVARWAV
jgi:hypothetical protein